MSLFASNAGGSLSFPGTLQYFEVLKTKTVLMPFSSSIKNVLYQVPRSGRKGLTIGQILVDNPSGAEGGGELAWAMRHRYRHGGEEQQIRTIYST